MQQEPSVLDFIKSYADFYIKKIISPGKAPEKPVFIEFLQQDISTEKQQFEILEKVISEPIVFPWRSFAALLIGIVGQIWLEPRQDRAWLPGVACYLFAFAALVWGNIAGEWRLPAWEKETDIENYFPNYKLTSRWLIIGLVVSILAFFSFSNNLFTEMNVAIWAMALVSMSIAFWNFSQMTWPEKLKNFFSNPNWDFRITRWMIAVVAGFLIALFFRTYLIQEIPSQMISDQAEKLWDIRDVLNGMTSIFFPRNTGREFFQFYLTASVIKLFHTGLSFMSLKIGTVFAGMFAVVYMYFLGKEAANKRVGLIAMLFMGIAYWPNVISRFGLRFPFYPMFYAPALYYLVRALKRRQQNDFVLSGLFVGLGLNGYSPYRVVPIVLVLAIALYLLHKQSRGNRKQAILGLIALGVVSLVIFLPLLEYMTENPDAVLFRAMTRIGTWERPLPGPILQIFMQNLWNGLTMFGWDNGEVWAISIPHRPALDVISAALFYLGALLMIIRYIRQRNWFDIFTLLSIPLLMMPSILSLAFPGENPSLNRPAAVIVPVFLIIGLALDGLMTAVESISSSSRKFNASWMLFILLFSISALQNYDLVFNQYRTTFDQSSLNTDEIGAVAHGFIEETGSVETAYLVGYPYWVDSRLVMINAGYPDLDNAIWPDQFQATLVIQKPKLFMINVNDQASIDALRALYPTGWLQRYKSKYQDKDFMMFFTMAANPNP